MYYMYVRVSFGARQKKEQICKDLAQFAPTEKFAPRRSLKNTPQESKGAYIQMLNNLKLTEKLSLALVLALRRTERLLRVAERDLRPILNFTPKGQTLTPRGKVVPHG
jgi:hypothetical protein